MIERRQFLQTLLVGMGGIALPGCEQPIEAGRYTDDDIALLAKQRVTEATASGNGPLGPQVYQGYRGLSRLPWFELDQNDRLVCIEDSVKGAIDIHAHLGMSVLFSPELNLQQPTDRVRHLLDCDATDPGCELDLDIYINGNFDADAIKKLQISTVAQGLWGSRYAETQTIPNLIAEMDAMHVANAFILPIKMGLPFGDSQTAHWRNEIKQANADQRLIAGLSVHPRKADCIAQMRAHAATGARLLKLHPTVQKFYPDDPAVMPVYEEAQKLGLVIFFHGGRAGIEPEPRLRYAMPRHYEAVLAEFPGLQVILGHAGARDNEAMVSMALKYENAWLGIHGQSVTNLAQMIRRTSGQRLLFGTDWPFYHIGASLAKVLLCTEQPGMGSIRDAILRGNAHSLFPELA
jgi:uncharacterized protein